MSDYEPEFPPSAPQRPAPPPAPPPRSAGLSCMSVVFALSVLLNLFAAFVVILLCGSVFLVRTDGPEPPLIDYYHSGNADAKNKIAIVEVDGVILEGVMDYPHKQIDTAARDKNVKAVVVRVNSPGGSITASDDIHHRLTELKNGDTKKKTSGKPLVVSMGAMAASGGYYISMPGQKIFAEQTTLTGSIGVYISFPNVAKMGDNFGFKMELVKCGAVKDSGSMFKEMTDEERQVWQDMVDDAYAQFKGVVEKGRPDLKGKLETPVDKKEMTAKKINKEGKEETVKFQYQRQRADGGVFTAQKAKELGLVDEIGYLEAAVEEAAKLAGISDYKVVEYHKPLTLDGLLGVKSVEPQEKAVAKGLSNALTPRLWYLAPQSELAGFSAAMGK